MADAYRFLTMMAAPFLPFWLAWRSGQGKEDPKRIRERYGMATRPRPAGTLVWLHAASVGEATSVLPLIASLRKQFPEVHLLLTTGTVTSATLMAERLPGGVTHQYIPIDTPQAVARFMRHWKPGFGLWVESEFWPNLIHAARARHCLMGVINARLSVRSFASWRKRPAMIARMLRCFSFIAAQSEEDATRFKKLGAQDVICLGNMKYDAAPLPCDEAALLHMQQAAGARPVWLAASTHPGEEGKIAEAHALLAQAHPGLLTIIAPRHPGRGDAIAAELSGQQVAQRSKRQPVLASTQIYIADTLGELGLFYCLCEIVFMGGSLVPHGGQNPLEPARLSCAVIAGPHTDNFSEIYRDMEKTGAARRVQDSQSLASAVSQLLKDAPALDAMHDAVKHWLSGKVGATERLVELLAPVLSLP